MSWKDLGKTAESCADQIVEAHRQVSQGTIGSQDLDGAVAGILSGTSEGQRGEVQEALKAHSWH